jgi:hypothetical protein
MYCYTNKSKPFIPEGCKGVQNENGYYTDEAYEEYVDFLLPQILDDGEWRLLVLDGFGSHTTVPSVLQKFRQRKIIVMTMPSHTSHALQPLDVTCFGPTKKSFRISLSYLQRRYGLKTITKLHSCFVFEYALEVGCKSENIISGFRACGIFPFDNNWAVKNESKLFVGETLDGVKVEAKLDVVESSKCDAANMLKLQERVHKSLSETLQCKDLDNFPELKKSVADLDKAHNSWAIPGWKRLAAICLAPGEDDVVAKAPKKPKKNKLGESFSEARILNDQKRIDALTAIGEQASKEAGAVFASKAQEAAAVAEEKARKARKVADMEPLLIWLQRNAYLPAKATSITKASIWNAYFTNKAAIDAAKKCNFKKSTFGLQLAVDFFIKNEVFLIPNLQPATCL